MNLTEHTKIRKEKFGTVLFDTLTEKIFVTDEIGGEILQLVEQGKDLSQMVSELCETFDGEGQIIEKDVLEFTEQLKSDNIISG
ncbi:MAG: PqqD family protein [Planctomycetes bacterium]|nr:PqqD family protein [Planctomycetota bacterium]